MANDNKYYKHIMYTDIQGVYGANMVAFSITANDSCLEYSNKFALRKDIEDKKKTFRLWGPGHQNLTKTNILEALFPNLI